MKRKAEVFLSDWQQRASRKPLVLRGARQVGKTYLVEHWGKKRFRNVLTVDLERERDLHGLFAEPDPKRLLEELALLKGQAIKPELVMDGGGAHLGGGSAIGIIIVVVVVVGEVGEGGSAEVEGEEVKGGGRRANLTVDAKGASAVACASVPGGSSSAVGPPLPFLFLPPLSLPESSRLQAGDAAARTWESSSAPGSSGAAPRGGGEGRKGEPFPGAAAAKVAERGGAPGRSPAATSRLSAWRWAAAERECPSSSCRDKAAAGIISQGRGWRRVAACFFF